AASTPTEASLGRTPNPDILCNKEIKFKEFLLQAQALGADYIATGHYVAKGSNKELNEATLLKGSDANKDQSYFLCTLQQGQLAKSYFPLGEISKTQVRQIAEEQQFVTHDKKDSTGICFIGERRFKDFLSQYLRPNPGAMVDENGKFVKEHDGLMYYTLGQRQGLDIGGPGEAWYVAGKDISRNELLVVQGHDHPELFTQRVVTSSPEWVSDTAPKVDQTLAAKTRYRQADQECHIVEISNESLIVEFAQPQRAVTPGQALVLYDGLRCLGGATIESSTKL
ncbi:MAG: tRNA 2-thiouridine(34) synthase MnmA, partial [Pseudomonadota bacterium]